MHKQAFCLMVFASDVEVHGRILVILRSKGGTLSVGGCLRVPRWECAISQPQTQASRKETAINPLWENKRLIDFVIIIKRIGHIPPCAWWYATWWHQSSSQSRFMLDQKHYITRYWCIYIQFDYLPFDAFNLWLIILVPHMGQYPPQGLYYTKCP